MLRDLTLRLGATLKARGVPLPVVTGPERTDTISFASERIVLEEGADLFNAIRSQRKNPKSVRQCANGITARIYARSKLRGANVWDHRDRARIARNHLITALDFVARSELLTWYEIEGGAFETLDDLQGSNTNGGALYVLRFSVDTAVEHLTWPTEEGAAGEPKEEVEITAVGRSNITVTGPGHAAETICED